MKQKFVTFMLALLATTALFAQNKVRFNTDPTYTLQSVYDSAPQF